ncbi:MAG: hypothetical protein ABIO55_06815 [Ginsengibacter sp.]
MSIFFLNSYNVSSQNFIADTSAKTSALKSALNLYNQFFSPPTGLYNGSEYTYNAYYPFKINEGDPFFQSQHFVAGAVFYNDVLYENTLLLYDIVKDELLIHDPTNIYVIRLNNQRIGGFTISGHTFIRLNMDTANTAVLNTGFYEVLYNGNVALYKKVSKLLFDRTSTTEINKYTVESNKYFIKKGNNYFAVKNKKSLPLLMSNKKREVQQFIRNNKLNFRKAEEDYLVKTVAYYDFLN